MFGRVGWARATVPLGLLFLGAWIVLPVAWQWSLPVLGWWFLWWTEQTLPRRWWVALAVWLGMQWGILTEWPMSLSVLLWLVLLFLWSLRVRLTYEWRVFSEALFVFGTVLGFLVFFPPTEQVAGIWIINSVLGTALIFWLHRQSTPRN